MKKGITIVRKQSNEGLNNYLGYNNEFYEFINYRVQKLIESDHISEVLTILDYFVYDKHISEEFKQEIEQEYKIEIFKDRFMFETDEFIFTVIK